MNDVTRTSKKCVLEVYLKYDGFPQKWALRLVREDGSTFEVLESSKPIEVRPYGAGSGHEPQPAASKELITAPENPTVEDLIAFYGNNNFRSGVTVRVPYRATRQALEDLQERVNDLLAQLAEKVIGDGSDAPQFFRNDDGDIDFGPVATPEPQPAASKELAYRDALARIRQVCRSDAKDFEAATIERHQVYDIANNTLDAHGDLYASGHEPPAEPTAFLDEQNRVVTVGGNRYGGFVGTHRAVPDSWTPLYRASQPPGDVPGLLHTLEVLRQRWSHNANFEATIGACITEIELCVERAARATSTKAGE